MVCSVVMVVYLVKYGLFNIAGGVVGIVLAALVISAALLSAVIVLIVCRIKTGRWFKIMEKDDHLTVNFAKHYLLSEGKPTKKKKKVNWEQEWARVG